MPQVVMKENEYQQLDQIQVELRTKGKKATYGDILEVIFSQIENKIIINLLLQET